MKSLALIVLLALAMPGCSHYSQNARNERAYFKYLKQTNAARGARTARVIKQERASMPASRPAPTPSDVEVPLAPPSDRQ